MEKKTAVLQWLNCLTALDPVNEITDLANGNHFLEFAKTINKVSYESNENETEEAALERRYGYIKKTINNHFHVDSARLINFESCKTGHSAHDLTLVVLLLLSAMVNHSVSSVVDQTRLCPLHELDLSAQEFIKECLEIILTADEETQLFAILYNIASSTTCGLGTPKTRFSSSPQQSPTVTPVLRKRIKRGKLNLIQSPLKVLIESPNFKQQVAMKEKKKEINNLRQRLNSEENKAMDFESKNKELTVQLHNKDKEIRELKEKVNFLNSFREHADEYDFKKAELEEQLAILEKKQKNCSNCKHQENCIKTLEDELFDLKAQNEVMATKCKQFQSQLETFEKDINERDSIIKGLTIAKSEDNEKIHELNEQMTKLLACEAIYKKKYEDNYAQIEIQQEPFQTPQRGSEGETLRGVIDKMLQEMGAELELEKTKVQELEEKVKQSQTQQKVKDEESKKLHYTLFELETKLSEIENSKTKLREEFNDMTVQYNLSVHQIATLESAIDALKLELSVKEKEFEGAISQLLEQIEQQKLELNFSKEDCSKLLGEKEASEKQLHQELEFRERSIDDLRLHITEYEEKILDLRQNCANTQQRVDAEKLRVIQLQNEKTKAITEVEGKYEKLQIETAATVKQLKGELQFHEKSIEDYIIKITEYEEKIVCLEKEKTEVITEVELLKTNYQKLLMESKAAKIQFNEKLQLQENFVHDFKSKIAGYEGMILTLKEDYNKMEQEKNTEKQSVIQLKKEKYEVTNALQLSKENYQQLFAEKTTFEKNWKEEQNLYEKAAKKYELQIGECNEQILVLKKDQQNIQQELSAEKKKVVQLQTDKTKVVAYFEFFKVSHEKLVTEKKIIEEQLNKELHLQKRSIQEYEAMISQLDGKILILQEECKSMHQEKDAHKENIIQLQKENNEMLTELELLNQKYQDMLKDKKSVERLLAEETRLQQMATEDYEAKISQLDRKIITLQEEHESAKQEQDTQREIIVQLQKEKNQVITELELLNQNFKNLIAGKEAIEKQLNKEVHQQKDAINDYETKMVELRGNITTLNDEQEHSQKARALENGTLIQLQKENNELAIELQTMKQTHQNSILDRETLEKEFIEKLQFQEVTIENYKAKISECDERIVTLKEQEEIIHQEKDVEREKIIQLQKEKTNVIAELDLLKINYQKLLIEAGTTEGVLNEKLQLQKVAIEEYKAKIIELDAKLAALNEGYKSMWQEREVGKETEIQLQEENNKMITKLELLKQNYQNLVTEKEKAETLLNEELQLQKIVIKECETKTAEQDGELVTLKEKLEDSQKENEMEKEAILQLQKEKNIVFIELELSNQNYQKLLTETETTKSLLNEELQHQKMTIEEYEKKIAVQNGKLVALNEEQEKVQCEKEMVIRLQNEKNGMIAELELLSQNYQKLLTETKATERQLNEELQLKKSNIEDFETKLVASQRKIEIIQQEQEHLQQENTAEKKTVIQLQKKKNEVIAELELLNQNCQKLLTEAETTRKELTEKLRFQEKFIDDYEAKITKQDKIIAVMGKEQETLQQQGVEDKEQIAELAKEKAGISIELELLNDKYQTLLNQTKVTEKQLNEELQFLKMNVEDYKLKITERDGKIKKLYDVLGQSPDYIEEESMLIPLENSENIVPSNVKNAEAAVGFKSLIHELSAELKAKAVLLKNEAGTLTSRNARRNASSLEILRIRDEMLHAQLAIVEGSPEKYGNEPTNVKKNKDDWDQQLAKLQAARNEELSNLHMEKNNLLQKLEESLKTLKLSKEKSDNEIKKLQRQLDEYKKIAEAATSEVKMMGEKLRNISKKVEIEKQLELVTAKYKKAKEIIEKLSKEKKDLGKKLDNTTELLRSQEQSNSVEAIRISNEECQALRKELEETKKSNEPLKGRIKELENARLIQEQMCKSLERELKLAHNQLVQLRKATEKCDNQSQRFSFSSSSPCSLKTPLIKKPKREAHFEKKHVYVRERVTKMIDDSFLMPIKIDSNFNHSFTSSTSEGHNKSVLGAGNLFQCADEEDFLNHSSLENVNYNVAPPSATKRLGELQRRNTLCPPHMRSSYAVEMQMQSPSKFSDEALKKGTAVRKVSPKRKRSSSLDENQKSDKEAKVVVEKKKKKSRKAFPAVNPEKFPWLMANRTPNTVRKFMKSIKEGFPNSPKPKIDAFWPFKS